MKRTTTYPILFTLACIGSLGGCNQNDQKSLTNDAAKLAATAGTAMKNAELAGKVNILLSNWKGIDSAVTVQSENGVITLEGTMKNHEEKRKVLSVVNQIRGVQKVISRLKSPDEER
ncbi:hypothetical protein LBMAG21_06300 [Armatimonadota bacterium]|nr:BON domain-containing protein [Armatimonadota bacterium]GDX40338.1 hypothetical protein LBMAG21_06300 [Armatimonadota bacterium]